MRDDLIAVLAVLSACVVALKLPQETDGPAIVAAAQALAARLEAAERERETNAERCLEALDDIAKLLVERNAAQARADAAEAKLAALVEAWDAWKRYGNPTSPVDLDEAIRRIQGAP